MKKIYFILISALVLNACSNDDGPTPSPFIINLKPTIPELVFPQDNLVCTNFNLEFDWNQAIDADSNSIVYTIEVTDEGNFRTLLFTAKTSENSHTFTLEKGTTYYWRVQATDPNGNNSGYSSIRKFFTEPEAGVNTIPYAPTINIPQLGQTVTGNTTTLSWEATDPDNDPLLFDLYFGETNPPQLLTENLNNPTFDVQLNANTTYYWRVVVKDNDQATIIGQVWNFRTQ